MQPRPPRDGFPYESCIRVILDEWASQINVISRNDCRKSQRIEYEFDEVFQLNYGFQSGEILEIICEIFKFELQTETLPYPIPNFRRFTQLEPLKSEGKNVWLIIENTLAFNETKWKEYREKAYKDVQMRPTKMQNFLKDLSKAKERVDEIWVVVIHDNSLSSFCPGEQCDYNLNDVPVYFIGDVSVDWLTLQKKVTGFDGDPYDAMVKCCRQKAELEYQLQDTKDILYVECEKNGVVRDATYERDFWRNTQNCNVYQQLFGRPHPY